MTFPSKPSSNDGVELSLLMNDHLTRAMHGMRLRLFFGEGAEKREYFLLVGALKKSLEDVPTKKCAISGCALS